MLLAAAPIARGRWSNDDPATAPPLATTTSPEPAAPIAGIAESSSAPNAPITAAPAPAQAAPKTATLTPLSTLSLGDQGFHGDVWGHKGFAYVGTWGSGALCPATGVKIVDLADPIQPRWVSTVANIPGTSQEDMVVRSISTPAFQGDLLAIGIQRCGAAGRAGVALYDVTDPRTPIDLGFFDSGARGVHELDLVQQGSRALALLAVPDSESSGGPGDFRIVDVSNPRAPVQLSAWGARGGLGMNLNGGIGCTDRIYDHSARASSDGTRVYLSYWDAGVIVLDISNPAEPRPLGRIAYPPSEEGSTHSVADTADGRYLLIADEDDVYRAPLGLRLEIQTADGANRIDGCESSFSVRLDSKGPIDTRLVDAGSACNGSPFPFDPSTRVALVSAGRCSLKEQATNLARAGAVAMITTVQGPAKAATSGTDAPLPIITVSESDIAPLRSQLTSGAQVTVKLPVERHWSGLRIWDIGDLAAPREIARYQTPNSTAFPVPGPGFFTVHNAFVAGDLALLSWYEDGVRVLDISDLAAPREVASYVPPDTVNPQRSVWPDVTMVWGVYLLDDLVLLSDVNSGLHVLRLSTQN